MEELEFETITQLIEEAPVEIIITINEFGIFVESNEELRREIELREPTLLSETSAPLFIEKLKSIL